MKKLIICLMLVPFFGAAQHTISGKFTPAKAFSNAFIYKSTPMSMAFVERSKIDSLGNFKITLDSTATPGIYKLVYAIPQDEYNVNLIYSGKEDIELSFDKDNGLEFIESTENKLWSSYSNSMDMVNATISNYYSKGGENKEDFKDVFKALRDLQDAYETNSEGYMAHRLIKANRPYIPEDYEDLSTYALNLKSKYLDNIDFSSDLLQSSDLVSDKVLTFVFGISEDTSDEFYQGQLKKLSKKTEGLSAGKLIPIYLPIWEQFKAMENDSMGNYIIDHYLMKFAEKTNFNELIHQLQNYKTTALGSKASNFKFTTVTDGVENETTLYDLDDAERYLVVFWSSTCGHCLTEMPRLKKLIDDNPNIKVIAIGVEDDDTTWKPEIVNYPNFIHILGLGKWDNKIVMDYAVGATPSFYLLDQDKQIIAKPDDVRELKKILRDQ